MNAACRQRREEMASRQRRIGVGANPGSRQTPRNGRAGVAWVSNPTICEHLVASALLCKPKLAPPLDRAGVQIGAGCGRPQGAGERGGEDRNNRV